MRGSFQDLISAYYSVEAHAMKGKSRNAIILCVFFAVMAVASFASFILLVLGGVFLLSRMGLLLLVMLCLLAWLSVIASVIASWLFAMRAIYMNYKVIKHVDDEMLKKATVTEQQEEEMQK